MRLQGAMPLDLRLQPVQPWLHERGLEAVHKSTCVPRHVPEEVWVPCQWFDLGPEVVVLAAPVAVKAFH